LIWDGKALFLSELRNKNKRLKHTQIWVLKLMLSIVEMQKYLLTFLSKRWTPAIAPNNVICLTTTCCKLHSKCFFKFFIL